MSKLINKNDKKNSNIFEEVGNFFFVFIEVLKLLFLGRIHFKNTINQLAFVGTDSLPIVLLTSVSIGMVFSFQITSLLQMYGANSAIGTLVGVAIVRELAPLFTGIVIAGRIGSSITAEIGSMKVTDQINAMRAMAVNPLMYLVIPRFLSCIIMSPLLTVLSVVIGISGGLIVSVYIKGVIFGMFIESTKDYVTPIDIAKCMFKASVFGGIVSLVSCYKGLNTGEGSQGVGISTTSAVVISLLSIFIFNFILSLLLW